MTNQLEQLRMSGGNTTTVENALRERCEHKVMTQHGKGMRDMAPNLVVGCNISGELAMLVSPSLQTSSTPIAFRSAQLSSAPTG
ncbi:hypothetical protein [Sphingopyxis terrae]|uniref:hypothetical protein n=1 Tax=Sphingopyxis terrae TaxID=33052 RepID=UPI003F7D2902